ncbi:MAG: decaprenyl-phosphate phosphoribosyltransferase [Candidatus Hydrogenedentes bacterium]|nr:decaprenyl-phosphate phosphoribosyltransferase [Candidatus Hydrogenedentota bacterium]
MATLLKTSGLYFRALRVYQWTKNLLVLAALVFAQQLDNPEMVRTGLLAYLSFCFAASATYLFNDIIDLENDRVHPEKRHRPIASGAVPLSHAWAMLLVLFAMSLGLAYCIRLPFLAAVVFYIVETLLYSLILKQVAILDVMAVALGFVVRAVAGALALDVSFSNWLVVCSFFLALLLTLGKRRHEIALMDGGASSHRKVLEYYSIHFLDQLILMMACSSMITYTIYTCSPEVVERLGTDHLYMTLPFVVYGLFRYLHLIHHKTGGGDPSSTLLKDWPLGATVALWGIACCVIIYG